MDKVEKRFLELAHRLDITDEELFEELCYIYGKSQETPLDLIFFERVKHIRKSNPCLSNKLRPSPYDDEFKLSSQIPQGFRSLRPSHVVKYEMEKRIRSIEIMLSTFMKQTNSERLAQEAVIRTLEQTLKTFMEQTKVERLSQEAVMQSLSNELDEFQEEFYDCQSEVKDQKERIGLIEESLRQTIQTVTRLECVPFVKDKTD